jgi:hypothetical protein
MVSDEKSRVEDFCNKLRNFNVHFYSLDKIVKMFIDEKKVSINKSLRAVDKDYFDRTDGSARGLICTVEATEIVNMVRDPSSHDKVLEEIFDDNVRLYLSRKNKINKKIIDTALSEERKALFWYLNNGITITCDSFSYSKPQRSPKIDLTNVQIVNGGQTTHALFEASLEQPDGLSDVLVLVRIIETRSESLSRAIAESTNSQTPINGRDLRSNDELQKKLEIGFDAVGYSYERKRNQWQSVEREKRIDALECAQAYIAYHLGIPEVAKKDRGRIFGDMYDNIYTEELSVQSLLCPYLLVRDIDKLKKEVQLAVRNDELDDPKKLFIIDGAFHVLYAVSLICLQKKKDIDDYPAAKKFIKPALKIVQDLVEQEMKKDETFSFNRFFKDSNTTKLIAMHVSPKSTAR